MREVAENPGHSRSIAACPMPHYMPEVHVNDRGRFKKSKHPQDVVVSTRLGSPELFPLYRQQVDKIGPSIDGKGRQFRRTSNKPKDTLFFGQEPHRGLADRNKETRFCGFVINEVPQSYPDDPSVDEELFSPFEYQHHGVSRNQSPRCISIEDIQPVFDRLPVDFIPSLLGHRLDS